MSIAIAEDALVPTNKIVRPSSPEITESDLHAALDPIAGKALRLVLAGLSVLFTVVAVSHFFLLPEAAVAPMVIAASGTAAAFLVLRKEGA